MPVIRKALSGQLIIDDFESVKATFRELYESLLTSDKGRIVCEAVAHNAQKWAVAVCSVDGQRMHFGDVDTRFPVQATSSPVTYCIALHEQGYDKVNRHIGREPSGRPSTEIILDHRATPPVPHNPFVNAGAIMSCALIGANLGDSETRVQYILNKYWKRLCGGRSVSKEGYMKDMYTEEVRRGDRNRCLNYLMSESRSFPKEISSHEALVDNLDFYFKLCSIEQDVDSMSLVAGTLANGGV